MCSGCRTGQAGQAEFPLERFLGCVLGPVLRNVVYCIQISGSKNIL